MLSSELLVTQRQILISREDPNPDSPSKSRRRPRLGTMFQFIKSAAENLYVCLTAARRETKEIKNGDGKRRLYTRNMHEMRLLPRFGSAEDDACDVRRRRDTLGRNAAA